jgi:signal transduction histidine kinase
LAHDSAPAEHQLRQELTELISSLGEVSKELQEISRGIHPGILSKGGLEPALRALARRAAVPVSLDVDIGRALPDAVEVAAYYVVAEALANTAKHAKASAMDVHARTSDLALHMLIRDDGIGGADARNGSGLVGLKDRVEALRGHLVVTSPVGAGTCLQITLPLECSSAWRTPPTPMDVPAHRCT